MLRKILIWIWLVLCGSLLVLSLTGVATVWSYKQPLTNALVDRAAEIGTIMEKAQTALQKAEGELERALSFVDTSEDTLASFSEQTAVVRDFLNTVTEVLDETIKPSLATSKEKIDEAQQTMDDLRAAVEALNRIPFVNLDVPDEGILSSFTEIIDSLEGEISRVEQIADQASAFMDDNSTLLGGDLNETRTNIQELQNVVTEYEGKLGIWREQIASVEEGLPRWINRTAIILTFLLLWFALSQFGMILHGLSVWRGEQPLAVLRREPSPEVDEKSLDE